MKKMIKILLVLQIMMWSENVLAQTFQATVNRTEVPQGETFLLTLETDDDKIKATPDISVLEKDFTVYSVGNAFQSSYVNGVTTHSRQWQIVLMPKNSGKIEIPAISLGNLKSEPITLNVVSSQLVEQADKQSSNTSNNNQPKFAVDASVDNKNPYVQQQVNYTFKIYDSGGLYGEEPVMLDNGRNDWIVKSLGKPEINSRVINGRQLREIEFKYALFPQKSGTLDVPTFEFNGYYLTKGRRGTDPFEDVFNSGFFKMGFSDMFATRNPVKLRAEPININVKPIPAANGGYWWLPASQVSLTAEWDDKKPVFRVGEAVSRSVYLKATGVIESQLPDLKFPEIEGMKQYPDKPSAMSTGQNGEIIAIKKFGNVFIPEKSGTMMIPAVRIDWYNIHTGQLEKAVLPAQTITVLPSVKGDETEQAPSSVSPQSIVEAPQTQPVKSESQIRSDKMSWLGIIGAFIGGVLISYLLFGHKREKKLNDRDYARRIEQAVERENIKEVRDNLLEWARLQYPQKNINNLEDVAKNCQTALKKQLEKLDKILYGKGKEIFDKKEFLQAFKSEKKVDKKKDEKKQILPKLYK